jgi:hypothetical protein
LHRAAELLSVWQLLDARWADGLQELDIGLKVVCAC